MSTPYFEHVTGPLERWDLIAYRYYGDASLYGRIVDANREIVVGLTAEDGSPGPIGAIPAVLPVGMVLRIPIVDEPRRPAPEDLPPWLR